MTPGTGIGSRLPDSVPPRTSPTAEDTRHSLWLTVIFALSGWAYVDIWVANRESLPDFYPLHLVAWSGAFFLIGLSAVMVIHRLMPGPGAWNRAYAGGVISVVGLQSWGHVRDLFSRLSAAIGSWAAIALLGVGFMAAAWLFFRVSAAGRAGRAFVVVVAAFLVGFQYIVVAQGSLANALVGGEVGPVPPKAREAAVSAPDVLVLILDGYGSGDVLTKRFGHDNVEFERQLSDLGVEVVEGAKATYSLTALSIAGLLDGRYPAIGRDDDASLDELQRIHSGENVLFRSLRASGYDVHLFDNAWTFTRCGATVDVCHRAVFDELDHAVLARTPAMDLMPSLRISPWIRGSVSQFSEATQLAGEAADAARLIYVHALIPHEPFQLDAKCNERWDPSLSRYDLSSTEDVPGRAYIEQIRCVNSLVVDLVAAMPDDAVILITGDHGPRWAGTDPAQEDTTDLEVLTRMGVLAAYRLPDACEQIPDNASIMTMSTAIFDCLDVPIDVESERDPRQPSRYFSHGEPGTRIEVIDITDRINALP